MWGFLLYKKESCEIKNFTNLREDTDDFEI